MKWVIVLVFIASCIERNAKPAKTKNEDTALVTGFGNSSPYPAGHSNEDLYKKNNLRISDTLSECENILYDYFPYWIRDSIGANGFRMVYAEKMLLKCLKGQRWVNVEKYLGRPFSKFTNSVGATRYLYQLSYFFPGEYSAQGNMFLWIEVGDGFISFCKIHIIDG